MKDRFVEHLQDWNEDKVNRSACDHIQKLIAAYVAQPSESSSSHQMPVSAVKNEVMDALRQGSAPWQPSEMQAVFSAKVSTVPKQKIDAWRTAALPLLHQQPHQPPH